MSKCYFNVKMRIRNYSNDELDLKLRLGYTDSPSSPLIIFVCLTIGIRANFLGRSLTTWGRFEMALCCSRISFFKQGRHFLMDPTMDFGKNGSLFNDFRLWCLEIYCGWLWDSKKTSKRLGSEESMSEKCKS